MIGAAADPGSRTGELLAIGVIIVALAALVLAVGLFRRVGSITAKLGSIELTAESVRKIEEVHDRVDQLTGAVAEVAQSVNNVDEGEPKLIDKVRILQAHSAWVVEHQHWMRRSIEKIAAHVGAQLEAAPSTRPPHVDRPAAAFLPPPPPNR